MAVGRRAHVLVEIAWGDYPLLARVVCAPGELWLGDAPSDFAVPIEAIGGARVRLLHFDNGVPVVQAPSLEGSGAGPSTPNLAGRGTTYRLETYEPVHITVDTIAIVIRRTEPEPLPRLWQWPTPRVMLSLALALALHVTLIVWLTHQGLDTASADDAAVITRADQEFLTSRGDAVARRHGAYVMSAPPTRAAMPTPEEEVATVRARLWSSEVGSARALHTVFDDYFSPPAPMTIDWDDGCFDFDPHGHWPYPRDSYLESGDPNLIREAICIGPMLEPARLSAAAPNPWCGLARGHKFVPRATVAARKRTYLNEAEELTAIGMPTDRGRRIMRANYRAIRECSVRHYGLGLMRMRMEIDATGAVESASLEGDALVSPRMSNCMLDIIRELTFDAPASGHASVALAVRAEKAD